MLDIESVRDHISKAILSLRIFYINNYILRDLPLEIPETLFTGSILIAKNYHLHVLDYIKHELIEHGTICLLYTSPSPRD